LSLFVKRGAFWELVEDARVRWGIEPRAEVPPSTMGDPPDPRFPLRCPNPFLPEGRPDPYEEREEHDGFLLDWWHEVSEIQWRVIPEKYRDKGASSEWQRFLAACVLYDPPGTELFAFTEVGGPEPEALYDSRTSDDEAEGWPRMLAPPIKSLQELTQSDDWALDCILFSWAEALRASGLNLDELLSALERTLPGFSDSYNRKVERDSNRYYIEVDEYTTERDVVNAFSMIRKGPEPRTTYGRPERDRLTAVECAVLKDRHDWTYRQIAECHAWVSKDTAKEYVKLGRKILKQR
jgi:hypothetical protein